MPLTRIEISNIFHQNFPTRYVEVIAGTEECHHFMYPVVPGSLIESEVSVMTLSLKEFVCTLDQEGLEPYIYLQSLPRHLENCIASDEPQEQSSLHQHHAPGIHYFGIYPIHDELVLYYTDDIVLGRYDSILQLQPDVEFSGNRKFGMTVIPSEQIWISTKNLWADFGLFDKKMLKQISCEVFNFLKNTEKNLSTGSLNVMFDFPHSLVSLIPVNARHTMYWPEGKSLPFDPVRLQQTLNEPPVRRFK